jgi:hypothetical protein
VRWTWPGRRIHCFAIDGYTDHETPAHSFGPEKVVAETAMLIYAASASRHRNPIATRIDDLARLLAPHARSQRVLVEIALHPALAFKFAVPHILLTKLGYLDTAFDDFLKSCVSASTRNAQDRAPSSSLERQWIRSLWSGLNSDAAWRAGLRNSVLNAPFDILGGLRTDAYAVTHLIMYCTDFGFRNRRLPRRRSVLLGDAASLLARYVDAEDYDLAGELLLAWPLIGGLGVPPPLSRSAFWPASRIKPACCRAETSTLGASLGLKAKRALDTRWERPITRLTSWASFAPPRCGQDALRP